MPQATDEQRRLWGENGGVGEGKAIQYLNNAGYILRRNWTWQKPEGHIPTEEEIGAIDFLIDEWDFGGIE